MSKTVTTLFFVTLAFSALGYAAISVAQEATIKKDPFAPFSFEDEGEIVSAVSASSKNPADPFANIDPVTSYALKSYRVIGTMTTDDTSTGPKENIVIVKAPDRHDYYLTAGSPLGQEGAIITKIVHNGIKVDANGKEIFIILRNRFEIEDDAS